MEDLSKYQEIPNYSEACLKAYGTASLNDLLIVLKVNDLMHHHFPKEPKYNITEHDLLSFSLFLGKASLEYITQVIKVINSSYRYPKPLGLTKGADVALTKLLIIAMAYSFDRFADSVLFLRKSFEIVLGLGRKARSSELIDNEHLIFLFKMAYLFSVYDYAATKQLSYHSIIYSMINQMIQLLTKDRLASSEAEAIIMPLIDFLTLKVKENLNLFYTLRSSDKVLEVLRLIQYSQFKTISKQKIIGFIATVYAGNYSELFLRKFALIIKGALKDYNRLEETREDISLLIAQLDLVREMIDFERRTIKDTPYYCTKAFILNNSPKSGFSVKLKQMTGKLKPCSMLFAFCPSELLPEVEYPLIAFSSVESNDDFLRIIIKSNEIIIIARSVYRGAYDFKPNKTYLVTIDWKIKSVFSSSVSLNISINNEGVVSKDKKKEEVDLKLNETFKVVIGSPPIYNNERHFIGKMHPFLLLKKALEEQYVQSLYDLASADLSEDYSDILESCITFDKSYFDKYSPVKDQRKPTKEYEELIKFIKENTLLVISPMSVISQLNKPSKLKFHELIYKFKKDIKDEHVYEFNTFPSVENCATYPALYNPTVREFLRYEGMGLLTLHLEYYYNLLQQKINKELQVEIMKGVSTVMKLVIFYLDISQVKFDILKDDYETILFSLVKVITLLTDSNLNLIQETGEELIRLFNAILSQSKKDTSPPILRVIASKMFIFLLQPRLFSLCENSQLKKLFHSLNLFLEDYAESDSLITFPTLTLLLKNHMLLSGAFLQENYFIPNKISIHHVAVSSYKEFKNMRKEYETLLGTFISKGDIAILNKVLCYIVDSPSLVIRYKMLKIFFFSRNKNLKELKEKKVNELNKKYNDLFNSYLSSDMAQKSDNPEEEKYKELIKSILLQLILEFKEKEKDKDKEKDKQLYDDIKNIKNSIIQSSTSLMKDRSNSSFNSQTNKSSNSSNNTSTLPDLKSAPLITIKNIVINGTISFFEVKSIFLLNYDSWDPKAKIFFITEKPLQSTDYLKCYSSYNLCLDSFNKQKKNHFLFFIQLIFRIQAQEDSTVDNTVLLFCNYIYQVFQAYTQSKLFIQPHIQCQFIHLFESRSIMCSFFTICFQSPEGSKYAKAVLQEITSDLVWRHPNPFLFKFVYSHMKTNPSEMSFVMKHIAETFNEYFQKEEEVISPEKSIIIIRFIIVLHKLICNNKITKDVFESDELSESLLRLIKAFKEKSLFLYSNLLLPISKKTKLCKTLYQIFHELLFKIFDIMEVDRKLDYVKELTFLDEYSLFYYLDTRKKKSNAKSKKHKKLYSDAAFQACEAELKSKFSAKDSETRLAVLEFYINIERFIWKMKLIGVVLKYEELLVKLRAEIIDVFTLLGSASFEKEEETLYNQALRQVQFLIANKKPKNGPCITANDIFVNIDTCISQAVEAEFQEKKEKLEKSEKSVEKLDMIESNVKETSSIKMIERKDSFSACENKCIEGGAKKSSKNLMNDIIKRDNTIDADSFFDLNLENPILCMKRDLLLKPFGAYFDDVYFSNPNFLDLKRKFKGLYAPEDPLNGYYSQNDRQTLKFPSKTKNFSSCKEFYPKMFLKQDLSFFRKANYFFNVCFKSFPRKDFSYKSFRVKHGLLNNKGNNLFSNDFSDGKANFLGIFPCERISNEMTYFGYLSITQYYILYQSDPEFKPAEDYNKNRNYLFCSHVFDMEQRTKQIIIQLSKINELFTRRFLYYPQAVEVFMHSGKSYFFNFFSIKKQLEFLKTIESINEGSIPIVRNPKDEFLTGKNYQQMWKSGKMTTFDYLLQINKYAGRSYNDLNQYPIIPWVFTFLKEKPEKRNLKLPISVQSEAEQKRANHRFTNPISKKYPSHFGIHFSNSAFVNTFLIRLLPFTYNQIKFQNNKFDFPDRQFTSFDMMTHSLCNHLDNRELIPEIFVMPEFAFNLNCIEFGKRGSDKSLVNNLQLPPQYSSPLGVMCLMKSALNSFSVKENINHWIDNIFGFNQKRIQKGCFIYPKQTYEQYIVPKFDAIQKSNDPNPVKIFEYVRRKISSIIPIGQFPSQLFDSLHLQIKRGTGRNKNIDDSNEIIVDLSSRSASTLNQARGTPLQKNLPNKPILYFNKSANTDLFYCLIKNLSKKSIAILDMDLNTKNIYFLDRMASMDKTEDFRVYHPKYSILEISGSDFFITCRYYDNTIKVIIVSKKMNYSIALESFVNCVKGIDANSFYSGLKNGRLIKWDIISEEGLFKALEENKSVIAHNGAVIAIEVNTKHEIVLTAGDDSKVFIRKMYDFELLSAIHLSNCSIGVDLQMGTLFDLVYVKIYHPMLKRFQVRLYTINGLQFYETEPLPWEDFFITDKHKHLSLTSNKEVASLSKDLSQKTVLMQLNTVASCLYYNEATKMLFISYPNGDISKTSIDISK